MTNRVNSKWHRECIKYGDEFVGIGHGGNHDIAYFKQGAVILPRGTRCSDRSQRNIKARIKAAALGRQAHASTPTRSRRMLLDR